MLIHKGNIMKYNSFEVVDTSAFCFPKNKNKRNDDSILPPKSLGGGVLMAIADGVGSYQGAKEASQIAIEYLDKIKNHNELIDISSVFYNIHDKVSKLTDNNKDFNTKRMLTTAISAVTIMEFNEIFIPLKDLPIVDGIISIYLMSDGSHSFWDKRAKFSDNTMNKICNFSASLRNRIERIKPEDDYSLVAASIKFNKIKNN